MTPPPRKKPPAISIALIKMGKVPQMAVRVLAANIQALLDVPVEMAPAMAIPE